ncbi:MAG: hypothetical protein AB7V06_27355 [Candidatus Obscuribacterales bacterium]
MRRAFELKKRLIIAGVLLVILGALIGMAFVFASAVYIPSDLEIESRFKKNKSSFLTLTKMIREDRIRSVTARSVGEFWTDFPLLSYDWNRGSPSINNRLSSLGISRKRFQTYMDLFQDCGVSRVGKNANGTLVTFTMYRIGILGFEGQIVKEIFYSESEGSLDSMYKRKIPIALPPKKGSGTYTVIEPNWYMVESSL